MRAEIHVIYIMSYSKEDLVIMKKKRAILFNVLLSFVLIFNMMMSFTSMQSVAAPAAGYRFNDVQVFVNGVELSDLTQRLSQSANVQLLYLWEIDNNIEMVEGTTLTTTIPTVFEEDVLK